MVSIIQYDMYRFFCQDHLIDIESKNYSARCTTNLIHNMWNITHQLWLHRNEDLHNTKAIHALVGLISLKISITTEYKLGLDELPSAYSPYFHKPIPLIISKSAQYLKL